MIGLRRAMARLVLRRGLTDLVVFGGFGLAALDWPTTSQRLAGVALAFLAFSFARDRPSRVTGILVYYVASRLRFDMGLGALLLIWAIRSAGDERRRLRPAPATRLQPQVSPEAHVEPVPVDERVARLQREYGETWIVEGLSGDPEVQRRAADASLIHVPLEAIPEIIERLQHLNEAQLVSVMVERVNALPQRDREAGLLAFVLSHHEFSVRDGALASLASIVDAGSAARLISALAHAAAPHAELVRLLSGLGQNASGPLMDGLQHSNRHERAGCIEALGSMRCDAARSAITECLLAREPVVRVATAEALGEMGSPEAVPSLLTGTRDKSWEVRAACAASLGQLNASAAVVELTRLASDPHGEVAVAARTALEAVRCPQ